jgi:HAD superfamily hydrolase (TIGR01490 family)
MENNSLALFDFDGTITRKDSWLEFIKFTHGKPRYYLGLWVLSPMLVLYLTRLIKNDQAKIFMFRYFYGGWKYERFKKAGEDFCDQILPGMLRTSAIEKIKQHQAQGHRVILITASAREWVQPWCNKMKMEIISTEVEIINQTLSGKLATENCYGQEKVNRLKALLNPGDYSTIYAYGDSSGDKEMLALAQHPHYKPFAD